MSQRLLNITDAHVVLVLIQIVVVLNDVSLELFLDHFLVQQKLDMLFLNDSPLELHSSVSTHALNHNAIGLRVELQARSIKV